MDTVMPPQEATLQGLIRRLPIPIVLFAAADGSCVPNERFADVYEPGQLASPEFGGLAQRPASTWEAVELRRHDGSAIKVRVETIAVPTGALLVVDDASRPLSVEHYEYLQKRIAELESLSATDCLTGVWNRAHLERTVTVEMNRAARLNQPVTLILLDIDHFKRVNDTYGHLAGDAMLKAFVSRIRTRIRGSDSLFRWGGEEFVVLATGVGYRGGAVVAEGLREAIAAQPFATVGPITASLGVAEYLGCESADEWFARTDQALYAAKAAGRNRVQVCREGASDHAVEQAQVGVLRLSWQEAYESGEPMVDAEHRQLFELGNVLIATAIKQGSASGSWPVQVALDSLLTHVARHFQHEEEVLAARGYPRLIAHQQAHSALLKRATELRAVIDGDPQALGTLVNFVVRDLISQHILKVDRLFFPLFQS